METTASPEIGVPRRFAIGTLLVLSAVYALLFRSLTLLNLDARSVGLVVIFLTVVGVAQVFLFGGQRPRDASLAAGFIAAPFMLLICFAASRWGVAWLDPRRMGVEDVFDLLGFMGYLAIFGVGLGYVAGCSAAGIFFVLDRIRRDDAILPQPSGDDPPGWDARFYDRCVNTLKRLSPAQRNPVRAATGMFVITVVIMVLNLPFWSGDALVFYWWVSGACIVFAPYLLGGFRRFGWLATLGVVCLSMILAIPAARNLYGAVLIVNWPAPPRWLEPVLAVTIGTVIGATLAASCGWLHWFVYRQDDVWPTGYWRTAFFVILLAAHAAIAFAAYQFAGTPRQIALRKIREIGGHFYSRTADGRVTDLGFGGRSLSQEDMSQLGQFPDVVSITISGAKCEPGALLELRRCKKLWTLFLAESDFNVDDLKNIAELQSLTDVSLFKTPTNDESLRHIGKLPMLKDLNLWATKVTDDGLGHLSNCLYLNRLCLTECDVTGDGLARLSGLSITSLSVERANITDEDLAKIAQFGNLFELRLNDNDITDAGIKHLATLTFLNHLSLSGTQITDEAVGDLAKITKLQRLDIANTAITRQGRDRLKQLLPRCHITHYNIP